ncbi:hypothetical protein GLOIN_2v1773495 [Rhizophagus clarus]|uniref:Crinkler effector protein N-terminal domain-containing protein n=1 Tax=Rhizophagus clarus TaxID=94130 RepID=A0A8H3L035_9GLOM|nr:hypothetical protein GLOIN_2v1773495 [Rhizophagus clarus]
MLLSCFVLGTGTIFSIPLSEKVTIKKDEFSIKSLTIDILKKHEDDIQKLGGNKMKPNFLFSKYFIEEPPAGKIHIIVQPPATTGQGHADQSSISNYQSFSSGLGGTSLPYVLREITSNEGVAIKDPSISLRFDIMSPLIRDLKERHVILVRGPSFSGKTSTVQILKYVLVSAPEFSEYRKEKKVNNNNKKSADQFWLVVKNLLQGGTNLNIIMFATYGYNYTRLTTPIALPESNCKSFKDICFF